MDVVVDGVDDEGRGRAVVGGLDVAVRGALPGDRVRAIVERVFAARGLAQARADDFVWRGPLHGERACPHPAPCAGCPLEGADPGFVRALKRQRVVQALEDAGLVERSEGAIDVGDVEPARARRQKVKLTAGGAAGRVVLGMYVPHSHDLEDAARCPHQDPRITAALGAVTRALDRAGVAPASTDPRGVKAVIARAFVEGAGVVVVTGAPVDDATWATLAALVAPSGSAGDGAAPGGVVLSLALRVDEGRGNSIVGGAVERVAGPRALTPLEGGPPASVDAFCQADPALAAHMTARAAAFLTAAPAGASEATFADLYAGAGGFARALLAAGAAGVVAVERAPAGVEALRALSSIDVVARSVEDALPALRARGPLAGLVADPPKAGLKDAAAGLAALGARRVVLVACDPDAGARDARAFVDAGYRLLAVEPLDLFPATPEVETLFFLERA